MKRIAAERALPFEPPRRLVVDEQDALQDPVLLHEVFARSDLRLFRLALPRRRSSAVRLVRARDESERCCSSRLQKRYKVRNTRDKRRRFHGGSILVE